jgi:hypothetical protein
VRIDSLVKTQTVQIVQQAYTVEEPDVWATQGSLCDGAEGHGIRDVLSEPVVNAVQPEALRRDFGRRVREATAGCQCRLSSN